MADRVISNPIINSPYRAPSRHFAFDNEGITDRLVEGRRESSYFVPVPRPRKRGAQMQLELGELTADQIEKNRFVNEVRTRVGRWRQAGHPDVTAVTRLLTAGRREGLLGLGPARSAGDPRNRGKNTSGLAPTAPKVAADGPAASRDEPRPVPPDVAKWMKTLIPGPEDGDPST